MNLSQKCQYGLRAVFELARRLGQGPLSIADIAKVQAIPQRFLGQILAELRQAGYVQSRRGIQGGYLLVTAPEDLTVGQVIRFFEGPLMPVKCIGSPVGEDCPLKGSCAFMGLWERARAAVEGVYDATTFANLMEEDLARQKRPASYSI